MSTDDLNKQLQDLAVRNMQTAIAERYGNNPAAEQAQQAEPVALTNEQIEDLWWGELDNRSLGCIRNIIAAAQPPFLEVPFDHCALELAGLVMSDCGIAPRSSEQLKERIAARIDRYVSLAVRHAVEAVEADQPPAVAVPEGYALVPVVPTPGMLDAIQQVKLIDWSCDVDGNPTSIAECSALSVARAMIAAAQKGGAQIAKHCERCHDGEGRSIFPFYGAGPHTCGWRMGKPVVGHSEGVPQRDWPANFTPDPELGGQDDGKPPLGTWTHCLHCGAGKKGGA